MCMNNPTAANAAEKNTEKLVIKDGDFGGKNNQHVHRKKALRFFQGSTKVLFKIPMDLARILSSSLARDNAARNNLFPQFICRERK